MAQQLIEQGTFTDVSELNQNDQGVTLVRIAKKLEFTNPNHVAIERALAREVLETVIISVEEIIDRLSGSIVGWIIVKKEYLPGEKERSVEVHTLLQPTDSDFKSDIPRKKYQKPDPEDDVEVTGYMYPSHR